MARQDVREAIEFLAGHDIVSIRYVDPDQSHPFGSGGGEIHLAHDGGRNFKFPLPSSREVTRRILAEIISAIPSWGATLVVDDLHHLLLRTSGTTNLRLPDVMLDAAFAISWLGYEKEVRVDDLMRSENLDLPNLGMALFQRLNKRARRHYRDVYVPMIQAYVQAETTPVIAWHNGISRKVYVQYDFHTHVAGRLITRGTNDASGRLLGAHFLKRSERNDVIRKLDDRYKLILLDYTAAEISVAAAMSGDQRAIDIIKSGQDLYGIVSEQADINDRSKAKNLVVGWLNGAGKENLSKNNELDIEVVSRAFLHIKSQFPDLTRWIASITEKVRTEKQIESPTGRILKFDDDQAGRARTVGVNRFNQSFGADMNIATYAEIIRHCIIDGRIQPLIHIHDGYILQTLMETAEDDMEDLVKIATKFPLNYLPERESLVLKIKATLGDCWE